MANARAKSERVPKQQAGLIRDGDSKKKMNAGSRCIRGGVDGRAHTIL